jgi:glycosyltransferase involved in cell wall biosynthesis
MAFVAMAEQLRRQDVHARFTVIGPDGGDLAELMDAIECRGVPITYEGSLAGTQVLKRLAAAQILVLPSVDEPCAMILLEAMSVGLPVVTTESNGLARYLSGDRAFVTDGTPAQLAAAVEALLADCERWTAASRAASALVWQNFSLDAVVSALTGVYDFCAHRRQRSEA